MHTTATPGDVSVTPVAVLDRSRFSPPEDPLEPLIFSASQTAAADSEELVPELINAWHEEYCARRALDELVESGALAALFG